MTRTGGWPAWRNNNPGNLKAFPFSYKVAGAKGEANNFAIFPDVQTGIDAQIKLLKLDVYQELTLEAAIVKYAPKSDGNDPKKYTDDVVKETGIKRNTPMVELDDEGLMAIILAMRKVENYKIGDIKIVDKPGYMDGDGKILQYIWRTRDDSKTRRSHRIREGAVFSWENPPPGGHPGEDFNCRCRAEELSPKKAVRQMKPPSHSFQIRILTG